ncbi:hypothetical protein JKF63_06559 [Porcisia hertigi]|uniref:Dynein light chain n=1 Tax=Porcisia hertigi TaxID=2761500 RepID=A0A836IXL4_9TRYP|nr:hypothetical protein JKF63_06559 [Porcisia hertigi]
MADRASISSSEPATLINEADATRAGTEADNSMHESSTSAGEALNDTTKNDSVSAVGHVVASAAVGEANNEEGEAAAPLFHNNDGDEDDEETADEDEDDAGPCERIAASDVKKIILQALSPYFDDDAGGGASVVPNADLLHPPSGSGPAAAKSNPAGPEAHKPPLVVAVAPAMEDDFDSGGTVQRYDHFKAQEWIALVCDGIMERLVALGKPFKFVVHSMVMRKCGAGVHVCSSCYYAPTDGWLSHAHDLSEHLYVVVTVYWCAV